MLVLVRNPLAKGEWHVRTLNRMKAGQACTLKRPAIGYLVIGEEEDIDFDKGILLELVDLKQRRFKVVSAHTFQDQEVFFRPEVMSFIVPVG